MKGFLSPDGTLYRICGKITELIVLNFWVLLCSVPILTIGDALTAMYAVLLKILREDHVPVRRCFWEALKENFRASTILWCGFLGFLGCVAGLYCLTGQVYLIFALLLITYLCLIYFTWVLILQSRYVYSIRQTLRNALLIWLRYPGSTFVITVGWLLATFLALYLPALPLFLLLGITLPNSMVAMLYDRAFREMEGPAEASDSSR